jgi:ElaB/YqjD/DUF883 family membrane-anchored ribosome-binding protein
MDLKQLLRENKVDLAAARARAKEKLDQQRAEKQANALARVEEYLDDHKNQRLEEARALQARAEQLIKEVKVLGSEDGESGGLNDVPKLCKVLPVVGNNVKRMLREGGINV